MDHHGNIVYRPAHLAALAQGEEAALDEEFTRSTTLHPFRRGEGGQAPPAAP